MWAADLACKRWLALFGVREEEGLPADERIKRIDAKIIRDRALNAYRKKLYPEGCGMKNTITAVDLFCGAGGTSTGLIQAAESMGKKVELTAINHWKKAIETHKANHADVRHLCENLDDVNPRVLFPDGRINLLVASPECTHHSNAAGGVPLSDQSRSSAWRVVEWASRLYIDNILVENVPAFRTWGPPWGRPAANEIKERSGFPSLYQCAGKSWIQG